MKNRLREIRKSRNISAEVLGKKIGITATHIRRLESGDRDFTLATLGRCCEALDCDPEDIADFPRSKKRKGYDRELMEISIGFLLEACEHYKVKTDNKKQLAEWTTQIYEGAGTMNLKIPQIRDLALMVVKPAAKDRKA